MNVFSSNLPPGFRFHPTDHELIVHYLKNKVSSSPNPSVAIIADVDIYKCNPWDLPDKAWFGEKEWFFFSPRDRKYPNGGRPNRAAGSGYWKATGTDKPIMSPRGARCLGVKKALVFYQGRPPKGVKTNWMMLEYRLIDNNFQSQRLSGSMRLDDWVLCRIRQKINTARHVKEHYYDANSSSPFTFGYLQGQDIINKNDAMEASHYDQFQDCLITPIEIEEADEQGQEGSQTQVPQILHFQTYIPTIPWFLPLTEKSLNPLKKYSIGALDELVPLPTIASTFNSQDNESNFQDSSPTTSTSNPLCSTEFII